MTQSNPAIEPQHAKGRETTKKQVRPSHKSTSSRKCKHCGAEIELNVEFCPFCGKKLVDYCTFCGAPMDASDTVCEECGMPAEGTVCPKCGTFNVRSFCRKCNEPLTRAAARAIEKAKEDPKVQQAAKLMDRAAELEEQLENAAEGTQQAEVQQEYQNVVKDINKLFEEMLPPAGSTPQEQYNYYSARKVAIETVRKVTKTTRTGWVCNYCGCFHSKPSDCAEPWHGGTWIYETEEEVIVTKDYQYEE